MLSEGAGSDRHADRRLCRASAAVAVPAVAEIADPGGIGLVQRHRVQRALRPHRDPHHREVRRSMGEDNRMSRGSKTTTKSVRPGIMPILFGRHLIDKAVFLSLSEVADNLPPLEEECIPVGMDAELAKAYQQEVEKPLGGSHQGDDEATGPAASGYDAADAAGLSRLSVWLGTDRLLGRRAQFVTVATPPNLPQDVIRPKEQALLDLVRSEQGQAAEGLGVRTVHRQARRPGTARKATSF